MNHLSKIVKELKQLSSEYGRELKVSFGSGRRVITLEIQYSSYYIVFEQAFGSYIIGVNKRVFHPEFDYWLRDELYTSLGIDGIELLSDDIENIIFRDDLVGRIERNQSFYRLKRATRKREDKILKEHQKGGAK